MQKQTIQATISSNITLCNQFDIELIISHILKKDRVFVITHGTQILTKKQVTEINVSCQKRADGYPLAYILGEKEFYGRAFKVNADTLIPRPETEILIDSVLSFISQSHLNDVLILDIGTGSGIIPITLNKEISKTNNTQILSTDISTEALIIAKYNAKQHDSNNITFFQSDLLHNNDLLNKLKSTPSKHLIITANLPYVDAAIKTKLIQNKESKSLKYEPQIALWSEDAGLNHYKQLISQTLQLHLDQPITSFYEISPEQYPALKQCLEKNTSNSNIQLHRDLSGKERIVQFTTNT